MAICEKCDDTSDIKLPDSPDGKDGDDGADGKDGSSILFRDTEKKTVVLDGSSESEVKSYDLYTLKGDTLDTDGDSIDIKVIGELLNLGEVRCRGAVFSIGVENSSNGFVLIDKIFRYNYGDFYATFNIERSGSDALVSIDRPIPFERDGNRFRRKGTASEIDLSEDQKIVLIIEEPCNVGGHGDDEIRMVINHVLIEEKNKIS